MASSVNFSGLSTSLPTEQMIQAILDQEGLPLQRMQAKQAFNTKRMSQLRSINSAMLAFNTTVATLANSSFASRSVTNSDSNNSYVSATASQAASGTYEVAITNIASKARLDNASFALSDATTAKVFDTTANNSATFAVKGTDGLLKTFTVGTSNNTLNGLRDAINASGAGITATVINSGSGATPYRLILTANDTGTGSTSGDLSITQIHGGTNTLGIAQSSALGFDAADQTSKLFDDSVNPTASFAVKGADGVVKTFSLQGESNSLTGLQSALNASGADVVASIASTGDVANPYRLVLTPKNKVDSTGKEITLAQTGGETNTLGIATGTESGGVITGGSSATFTDGTVTSSDPLLKQRAVDAVFSVNGVSLTRKSNSVSDVVEGMTLTLKAPDGGKTSTITVSSDRSAITAGMNDVVTRFNTIFKTYKDNSGTGGTLAGDTVVRGLIERLRRELVFPVASVSSDASVRSGAEAGFKTNRDGTLSLDTSTMNATLERDPKAVEAMFQKVSTTLQETVFAITSAGTGDIAQMVRRMDTENTTLARNIQTNQDRLERRRETLKLQFANLEATVGKMQSAGQSLAGIR